VAWFSWWLLSNCSRCFLLKAAHPEQFPCKVPVSPGLLPSFYFQLVWANLPIVINAPTSPAPTLYAVFSFVSEGANPSTISWHFPQPNGSPNCSLCNLQLYGLPEALAECSPASQMQLLFQASVPYAIVAYQFCPMSSLKCPSFSGSFCNIVPAWSLTTMSLAQCRNGMVGHLSAGGSQLLPGPNVSLGSFSCWWHPTTRCRCAHTAPSVLQVSSVASSLWTCSAMDFISSEFASCFSR
jgi:hypothetical protein